MAERDVEELRRRVGNLKEFGLLRRRGIFSGSEEDLLASIADGDDYEVPNRFLLLTTVYYDGQEDSDDKESVGTLEEVEAYVVDKYNSVSGDYTVRVDVYDLNAGKRLLYKVVTSVKWEDM